MKSNIKKSMSVALCTALLSTGGLATLTNVAHAEYSDNGICARNTQASWTETLTLQLKRKTGTGSAKVDLKLTQENNQLRLICDFSNVAGIYDYWLSDDYVFGIKTSTGIEENFKLNNDNIGAYRNGNVASKIQKFVDDFNKLKVTVGGGALILFYAHGVNRDDSLTFSGEDIVRPTKTKDYSKGYASRGIKKWENGFDLRANGIYETPFLHKR